MLPVGRSFVLVQPSEHCWLTITTCRTHVITSCGMHRTPSEPASTVLPAGLLPGTCRCSICEKGLIVAAV